MRTSMLVGLVLIALAPTRVEANPQAFVATSDRAPNGIEIAAVSSVPFGSNNASGFDGGWGHYADVGFGAGVGYARFLTPQWTLTGKASVIIHGGGFETTADLGPTRLRQFPMTVGARFTPSKWFYVFGDVGPNIVRFEEQSFVGPVSNTELDLTAGIGAALNLDYVHIFGAVSSGGVFGFGDPMRGDSATDTAQVVFGATFPIVAL